MIVVAVCRLGVALVKRSSPDHTVRGLKRADLDLADPGVIRRALEALNSGLFTRMRNIEAGKSIAESRHVLRTIHESPGAASTGIRKQASP